MWSQFSTKVSQITILDIKDGEKNKCHYSKENPSLEQRIYIYIIECFQSRYFKKEGRKIFSRITKR